MAARKERAIALLAGNGAIVLFIAQLALPSLAIEDLKQPVVEALQPSVALAPVLLWPVIGCLLAYIMLGLSDRPPNPTRWDAYNWLEVFAGLQFLFFTFALIGLGVLKTLAG